MTPATLWKLFVGILVATAAYLVFFPRTTEAPPEIAALEMAKADFENTGSCYTLHDVLAANQLTGDGPHKVHWTTRVRDEWTLRVDGDKTWRTYRFDRENGRMIPRQVVSSDNLPQVETQAAIDEWVAEAVKQNKPKVQHCL